MSRNGSGVQSSPVSSFPAVDGTVIEAAKFNNVITDINNEISNSIAADGQTSITANIPINGFKITGAAAATISGQYVEYDQFLAGLASVSGDGFEAGTSMVFTQSSAPTGWTIDSSKTDRLVYINTSSGGSNGGSHDPLTMNKVPSHTHSASTSSTQASHNHATTTYGGASATTNKITAAYSNGASYGTVYTNSKTPAITSTTTVNANASSSNWLPKYTTGIIATKDA